MMRKFRKLPIVVEAEQWFPDVRGLPVKPMPGEILGLCKECGKPSSEHGWIETLEGGHIVCPADWIIKGIRSEFYPCKPDVFVKTYESAD